MVRNLEYRQAATSWDPVFDRRIRRAMANAGHTTMAAAMRVAAEMYISRYDDAGAEPATPQVRAYVRRPARRGRPTSQPAAPAPAQPQSAPAQPQSAPAQPQSAPAQPAPVEQAASEPRPANADEHAGTMDALNALLGGKRADEPGRRTGLNLGSVLNPDDM